MFWRIVEQCMLTCVDSLFVRNDYWTAKTNFATSRFSSSWHCELVETISYLKSEKVDLMNYCPYSLYLEPNYFLLFPFIKKEMRGHQFRIPEGVVEACTVSVIRISEWHTCYENWLIRMKNCTDTKGEYFKKQWNTLFLYGILLCIGF